MERLNINEVEKLKKVLNSHFDNYTKYTSIIYIKGDDLVYDIHINLETSVLKRWFDQGCHK